MSVIYFIQKGDSGLIKIGRTANLILRVNVLQKTSKQPLRVLGILEGGDIEEKKLHKRFDAFRLIGEWFEPVDQITRFIAENTQEPYTQDDFKAEWQRQKAIIRMLKKRQGGLPLGDFSQRIFHNSSGLSPLYKGKRLIDKYDVIRLTDYFEDQDDSEIVKAINRYYKGKTIIT